MGTTCLFCDQTCFHDFELACDCESTVCYSCAAIINYKYNVFPDVVFENDDKTCQQGHVIKVVKSSPTQSHCETPNVYNFKHGNLEHWSCHE